MSKTVVLLLLSLTIALSLQINRDTHQAAFLNLKQDDAPVLKVHMIAHSHDDMGWLETVDGYYYGTPDRPECVKDILDKTIPYLIKDPSKKFIYVEMGFFKKWWDDQTDDMKTSVRKLVKNGQLEFINGGYVMNDEADVYYEDLIEQMTLGHKFLLENFGVKPEIGWQIDPFGHASAQAALYAQMGYKAFFVGRIDYQDKAKRLEDKSMEVVWVPETSQGNENAILMHVNFYHYLDPKGYCFDTLCTDGEIDQSNMQQRAEELVDYFRTMKDSYQATDLIHTAGTDFSYMKPELNFKNYDKLFSYIDAYPEFKIEVEYSTPSKYLNAVYPLNLTYPTNTDDFFPYADNPNAYWTGYFTSRVAMKGLVRESGRFLQAAKRLTTELLWQNSSVFALKNFKKIDNALYRLEEAVSIAQHHDGVSGTEKQHVADDYVERILKGEKAVNQDILNPILKELVQKDLKLTATNFTSCLLNESATSCDVTNKNLQEGNTLLVAIYNSGPERSSTIRVKVPHGKVGVTNYKGEPLGTDVICANSTEGADCDLFFSDNFDGYGLTYYYMTPSAQSNEVSSQELKIGQEYKISPLQSISLVKDLSGFEIKSCKDESLEDCYSTKFNLKYDYYESYQDNGQKSGAYIFRNQGKSMPYGKSLDGKIFLGKNLLQIHLDNEKILSNMRIYKDLAKGIEVESYIDSIEVEDWVGKEIIMRVEVPSIHNEKTFYTDSMGMEMQKRVIDYRSTWDLEVTEPIAGNYYPVLSTILIKDEDNKESLAILPDRSQGGASLGQGQIELMIHRRLTLDDARGVEEPLSELDWDGKGLRQWVKHVLLFNQPGYIDTHYREIQTNIDMPNLVLLSSLAKGASKGATATVTDLNGFSELNNRIKWTTRPLSASKFLFRFQNMHPEEIQEVSNEIFNSPYLGEGDVKEMSLSANQLKSEMVKNKFDWNRLGLNNQDHAKTDYLNEDGFSLRPLEIRTFIVDFEKKINKN